METPEITNPAAGSGPTDGEMLTWMEKNHPVIESWTGAPYGWFRLWIDGQKVGTGNTLRAAIADAIKEAK